VVAPLAGIRLTRFGVRAKWPTLDALKVSGKSILPLAGGSIGPF